jgi:hypothetical protein
MKTHLLISSLVIAAPLAAQDSASIKTSSPIVAMGVTTGTMAFRDQRVQQAVTGVLRYHFLPSVSVSASPTFARVAFPATLGGGAVSGLTDLPIELGADHTFDDVPLSPTTGLSLGASLPIGDKSVGLGTGAVGANVGVGVGLAPIDPLSFHLGVGKALNNYSLYSTLGASSSAWGDLETSYQLADRVEATVGIDGDIAAADSIGPSRAVAMSLAMNLAGPYTLTVSGGHGISGAAARWSFAVSFGTDFTGIQSLGSSSPIQRFMRSLGGGSHGAPTWTPGGGRGRAP